MRKGQSDREMCLSVGCISYTVQSQAVAVTRPICVALLQYRKVRSPGWMCKSHKRMDRYKNTFAVKIGSICNSFMYLSVYLEFGFKPRERGILVYQGRFNGC